MNSFIESRQAEVKRLCKQFHLKRLELFGSATRDDFNPASSDIDFLVEFPAMEYVEHANAYFEFKEELENLFGTEVDLVESKAIKNPYFLESVNKSKALVYAS